MRHIRSICGGFPLLLLLIFSTTYATIEDNLLLPHTPGNCILGACKVYGNVGSAVIFDDSTTKIWNFTLGPGEMTTMHRHDCGYHFLALSSAELELYGNDGELLMDFNIKEGDILGFSIQDEMLVQTASTNPIRIPRTHAAKNVGQTTFKEILFESKHTCEKVVREL